MMKIALTVRMCLSKYTYEKYNYCCVCPIVLLQLAAPSSLGRSPGRTVTVTLNSNRQDRSSNYLNNQPLVASRNRTTVHVTPLTIVTLQVQRSAFITSTAVAATIGRQRRRRRRKRTVCDIFSLC